MRVLLAVTVFCACAVWLPAAADEERRYCGKYLAEKLWELCRHRGGFNEPPQTRPRSASQGGVARDCCRKGCSRQTLLSYCKSDNVLKPQPQPPTPRPTEACSDEDDEDDDQLFSLPPLHREDWCDTWQPAAEPPPGGEVECTCSRGGGQQPDSAVRKSPRPPTRQPRRQPPRQPPTTPASTPAPATRRPVVRGTVTPYFQGRPVVLSPPHAQRLPTSA